MKYRILVVLALLILTSYSGAAVQFPEHNFSLEVPPGWSDIAPRPPLALVALQNHDNSQRILAFAVKLPANERETGASDIRAGAKKSMTEQGWRIDPEQKLSINGQPFISFAASIPNGATITAYTTAAGDEMYMIQAIRSPGVTSDSELQSIVQSFTLLSPAETPPLDTPPKSAAFRAGYVAGGILSFGGIPCAILLLIWLVIRAKSKRKVA